MINAPIDMSDLKQTEKSDGWTLKKPLITSNAKSLVAMTDNPSLEVGVQNPPYIMDVRRVTSLANQSRGLHQKFFIPKTNKQTVELTLRTLKSR